MTDAQYLVSVGWWRCKGDRWQHPKLHWSWTMNDALRLTEEALAGDARACALLYA
jgi:hypothetical protein